MLTRLYVDNYKCLVNFDLRLRHEHLFLGSNGTGKTTVVEVISSLRRLIRGGARVEEAFPYTTLTRWQRRPAQTFKLEATVNGMNYQYELVIEQAPDQGSSSIQYEQLLLDNQPLYASHGDGWAKLYKDDGGEGPLVMTHRSHSGIFSVRPRADTARVTSFKQWFENINTTRIDPRRMTSRSEREETEPSEDLSNFASWFRHLTQEKPNVVSRLLKHVHLIFNTFEELKLPSAGEGVRVLRSTWQLNPGGSNSLVAEYTFDELSEGQRALIGLYALLFAFGEEEATLILDEPDNFLALPEIQPFIQELRQRENIQALYISHHPEIINLLAPNSGLLFQRVAGGPVRVDEFRAPPDAAISAAELISRGELDG